MLKESLILCKHGNILVSFTLKQNTISSFLYYIRIVEKPTNKGANSYKLQNFKNRELKISSFAHALNLNPLVRSIEPVEYSSLVLNVTYHIHSSELSAHFQKVPFHLRLSSRCDSFFIAIVSQ